MKRWGISGYVLFVLVSWVIGPPLGIGMMVYFATDDTQKALTWTLVSFALWLLLLWLAERERKTRR